MNVDSAGNRGSVNKKWLPVLVLKTLAAIAFAIHRSPAHGAPMVFFESSGGGGLAEMSRASPSRCVGMVGECPLAASPVVMAGWGLDVAFAGRLLSVFGHWLKL